MSREAAEYERGYSRPPGEYWEPRYDLAERRGGGLPGWLVTGLIAAGVGALAWYYLGPDLRRYLKIRSM
jgi:hypothetical protein